MHSFTVKAFVASAVLAQLALAGNQRLPQRFFRRQAFDPDETTQSGANCVDAFGEGYVECRAESALQNRLCINPDLGETCCENEWGCPADSFCLVQDLCCPTVRPSP
ncbi:hypothetical protein M501DRAFT_997825 [Patellaria atrata CBS 101060]|uniref:Uncharacterized protein n=1 Tax=Patellaria atrata CBS 101060 TaxID=1346257 RepID=A0A9P4S602_9PEZI|nr:hypothetical protein M501DRAFT_997825 [Patellaria atrata CBS 101060]